MSGLSTLGSNAFLPSDEVSDTIQITDDFTKIYRQHSFKMGIEFQNVKFSTLQPAYSRGDFEYNNNDKSVSFTDIPGVGNGNTGRAQFLLTPTTTSVPGGVNYVGGADQVQASNISKTYDEKKYFATYFQDDWKITPKLTLNLGIRYDLLRAYQRNQWRPGQLRSQWSPQRRPALHHSGQRQRQSKLVSEFHHPPREGRNHPSPNRQVWPGISPDPEDEFRAPHRSWLMNSIPEP